MLWSKGVNTWEDIFMVETNGSLHDCNAVCWWQWVCIVAENRSSLSPFGFLNWNNEQSELCNNTFPWNSLSPLQNILLNTLNISLELLNIPLVHCAHSRGYLTALVKYSLRIWCFEYDLRRKHFTWLAWPPWRTYCVSHCHKTAAFWKAHAVCCFVETDSRAVCAEW